VGRALAYANHDEGRLTLLQACRKKAYYAGGLKRYVRDRGAVRALSIVNRPYLTRPWKILLPHPLLGLGVVALKTGELAFVMLTLARDATVRSVRRVLGLRQGARVRLSRAILLSDTLLPVVGPVRRLAFRARRHLAPGPVPDGLESRDKAAVVIDYARRHGARVLLETGTYLGDMVEATRPHFDRVISIELDTALHGRAAARFARDPGVSIIQGDSAVVLPEVLAGLDGPVVFWLDAHFSGGITAHGPEETPVLTELETILRTRPRNGDVILIDDARCFNGADGYPRLADVESVVKAEQPELEVDVLSDIVRIHRADRLLGTSG
jgi:hypothetical protein